MLLVVSFQVLLLVLFSLTAGFQCYPFAVVVHPYRVQDNDDSKIAPNHV